MDTLTFIRAHHAPHVDHELAQSVFASLEELVVRHFLRGWPGGVQLFSGYQPAIFCMRDFNIAVLGKNDFRMGDLWEVSWGRQDLDSCRGLEGLKEDLAAIAPESSFYLRVQSRAGWSRKECWTSVEVIPELHAELLHQPADV